MLPARLAADIVRSLRRRQGRGRRRRRRGQHQRRPLAVQRAAAVARRVPAARRRRPASAVTLDAAAVRRGAAPGGARGQHRRRPADPHRRAAGRRGRRAAPRRHRLLPARGPRPAGRQRARRGPEGARAGRGRSASCSGCSAAAASSRCASASATRRSRSATTRLTTRLIEGEFPNYRQLIPPASRTAHRRARAAARGRPPGEAPGPRRHAGAAADERPTGSSSRRSPRTSARPPRSSTPSTRAPSSPSRSTPSTSPPASRRRVGDEVTLATLDALKPAVVRGVGSDEFLYLLMPVRVPVTHGRARVHRATVSSSIDFRNYDDRRVRASTPGTTAVVGRNGQGKTNLPRRWRTWPRSTASGARRPTRSSASAPTRRSCGPRCVHDDGRELLVEAELQPRRPQPGAGQPAALGRGARPARRRAGQRVLARRPRAGEGRPGRAAPLPRRHAGRARARSTTRCASSSTASCSSATPCSSRPAGGSTTRSTSRSTCGTPSWPRSASSSGMPRAVLVARLAPMVGRGLRAAGRTSRRASSCATTRRGADAAWPPRWPRRAPTTCAAACPRVGPAPRRRRAVIDGLPARTHASQGEQRSLALALRLGRAPPGRPTRPAAPPVLLLDDVFSELDPTRATALLAHLPPGQVVLTTAGALPAAAPCPTRSCASTPAWPTVA